VELLNLFDLFNTSLFPYFAPKPPKSRSKASKHTTAPAILPDRLVDCSSQSTTERRTSAQHKHTSCTSLTNTRYTTALAHSVPPTPAVQPPAVSASRKNNISLANLQPIHPACVATFSWYKLHKINSPCIQLDKHAANGMQNRWASLGGVYPTALWSNAGPAARKAMTETHGHNEQPCHLNGAVMGALVRLLLGGAQDLNESSDRMSYTTAVLMPEKTVRQRHSQPDAGRHLTRPRRRAATALVCGGPGHVNTTQRPCANHVLPSAQVLVAQVGAMLRRTIIGTRDNRVRLGRNGYRAPHATTTPMKATATD
jgi:hypothetical protein